MTLSLTTSAFIRQLMTTAMILVRNRNHELMKCSALLDTCVSANFISEDLVKRLKLPLIPYTIPIGAINSMNTILKDAIQITIQSLHSSIRIYCACRFQR